MEDLKGVCFRESTMGFPLWAAGDGNRPRDDRARGCYHLSIGWNLTSGSGLPLDNGGGVLTMDQKSPGRPSTCFNLENREKHHPTFPNRLRSESGREYYMWYLVCGRIESDPPGPLRGHNKVRRAPSCRHGSIPAATSYPARWTCAKTPGCGDAPISHLF